MGKETFITLLISSLIGFNSCTQNSLDSTRTIQLGEVIINGHINKYNGENKTGSFIFLDAVTRLQNQEVFLIDSIGNFKTSFDLICPTMFSYIQIGKTFFYLYLIPGETYNVTINENGTHIFTGENCELNNQIFEINAAVESMFKNDMDKLKLYHHNDSSNYQSFEKFCDDLLKRKLTFIDEYCTKKEINKKARDLV